MYSLLLVLYCIEASFVEDMTADIVMGVMIAGVVLVTDRKTVGRILSYARNIIKK